MYFPGLASMIAGNFLALYVDFIVIRTAGRPELMKAAVLAPLYWMLISVGALRAFLQLAISPFFWEKTAHGLDRPQVIEAEA